MSLVVSVGGKIESYYSFKKDNLNPIAKSSMPNVVEKHEDEQEQGDGLSHGKPKNQRALKESYGKQPDKPPKRKTRIFAKEIMSSPVRTINKEATVLDAVHSLNKFNNKHLLVSENNLIIGILSDRDLLSYSWNQESLHTSIEGIMSNEVILAKEDAEIKVLANIMVSERISAIPIVDEKYQLKGIVTQTDLLKCIMNNMPLDVQI